MSHSKMIQAHVKYDVVERKNLRRTTVVHNETIDLHQAQIVDENEAPFALEISLPNTTLKLRSWQGKLYRNAAKNLDLSAGVIRIGRVFPSRAAAVNMTWLEPGAIIINDRAWVPATLPHLQVTVHRYAITPERARVTLSITYPFNADSGGHFSLRDYDAALAHATAVATKHDLPLDACNAPQLLIPELVPHDERVPDREHLKLKTLVALAEARRLIEDTTHALLQETSSVQEAHTLATQADAALQRALVPLHRLNPMVS